jgi:hypothetical protein
VVERKALFIESLYIFNTPRQQAQSSSRPENAINPNLSAFSTHLQGYFA